MEQPDEYRGERRRDRRPKADEFRAGAAAVRCVRPSRIYNNTFLGAETATVPRFDYPQPLVRNNIFVGEGDGARALLGQPTSVRHAVVSRCGTRWAR